MRIVDDFDTKYPFGKFKLTSGIGMLILMLYLYFVNNYVIDRWGEEVIPYAIIAVGGIPVFLVIYINDKFPSSITVPLGILAWVLCLLTVSKIYVS